MLCCVGMLVSLRAVTLGSEGNGLCTSTLRELKLLSQLRHPHIVRLLEIVKDKNSDVASTANYINPSGTATTSITTNITNRLEVGDSSRWFLVCRQ